jgi:hypothetical protein
MAKFAVPGVLLTFIGVIWILQGAVGKTSSGGMNGHPIWAVIGVFAVVCGIGLIVAGKISQSRRQP